MATRMQYSFDEPSRTHTWSFGDGLADVSYIQPEIVSDDPVAVPMLTNGAKQKIADSAALVRDTKTGQSATMREKHDAMQAVVDRLMRGEWNAQAGGKPRVVDVDCLVAAIAATRGKPVIGVRAYVEGRTEEQRKALADSKEFAEAYVIVVAQKRPVRELDDATDAEIDAI